MKYLIALTFLYVSHLSISQQYVDSNDPKEIKSLLSSENEINGFGGMDIKVTDIFSERAMILGGYGGVLVNRRFMLGVAGYGIATDPEFEGQLRDGLLPDTLVNGSTRKLTITGGYAGLMLGGILFTREIVHISIPVTLGAGQLHITDKDFFQNSTDTDYTIESSTFFYAEPGVQLEFNMTSSFRIAIGATYRAVYDLDLTYLEDKDLTDWTATVSFRIGRY